MLILVARVEAHRQDEAANAHTPGPIPDPGHGPIPVPDVTRGILDQEVVPTLLTQVGKEEGIAEADDTAGLQCPTGRDIREIG